MKIMQSLPCVRGGVKAFGFDGGVVGNEQNRTFAQSQSKGAKQSPQSAKPTAPLTKGSLRITSKFDKQHYILLCLIY